MDERIQQGMRTTLIGLFGNLALAGVKLLAGLAGRSAALVADAVESFADSVSSIIVWGGLRIAARPPDATHPYGHGKAEPLAGLAVSIILMIAAIGIVHQAIVGIATPDEAPAAYTLYVLVGVVVVKELLYRYCARAARTLESVAVSADAWHHRSDAITSLIAAVGISVSLLGGPGYEVADDWGAILAGGIIAFNGTRFARIAMRELMDTQPSDSFRTAIRRIAGGVNGVRDVEKILARKMGMGYWVDMHIEVDGTMSVTAAHDLAHRVKDAILAGDARVKDVLIHVEPCDSRPD